MSSPSVYHVPGIRGTKEHKTGPHWQIPDGLLGEVRYAQIAYTILSYAVILICRARLPKAGRRKEKMGAIFIWINQGGHSGGRVF